MSDELAACWAALVAYVEDVHAPQDNLTDAQWQAAERLLDVLNNRADLSAEDRILFNALGVMLDQFDAPDMPEADWLIAERVFAEYGAKLGGVAR